jgi:hypothetical protein
MGLGAQAHARSRTSAAARMRGRTIAGGPGVGEAEAEKDRGLEWQWGSGAAYIRAHPPPLRVSPGPGSCKTAPRGPSRVGWHPSNRLAPSPFYLGNSCPAGPDPLPPTPQRHVPHADSSQLIEGPWGGVRTCRSALGPIKNGRSFNTFILNPHARVVLFLPSGSMSTQARSRTHLAAACVERW